MNDYIRRASNSLWETLENNQRRIRHLLGIDVIIDRLTMITDIYMPAMVQHQKVFPKYKGINKGKIIVVAGTGPSSEYYNAQAILSYYKGRMLGTIGDIASFSFENPKHISCGEGGMILTDSEEYAQRCRKLGGHGFKNLRAEDGRVRLNQEVFQNPEYKRHDALGWNYRVPEFTAAVAYAQLERVDELVRLRQDSAKIFSRL